ncbi:glycerol-3-phosphate dehydrogenase [Acuticoccus kandeliae]|uniref:glycerol-3-phosphate dehydrogenase n=1 Tax=Acuticoccus kandeliae TaxID=2073160 RepID=UPI000D3E9A3C|nr:glycerol-3-phosphate dehydrogenase [Acuticoccus kandeliae]
MAEPAVVDVFVVGGGINGCGIARDLVGRGYTVALAEMNDFASGTSSWSTKLIHGGLRYLEHYEFRLVREALIEREVLWGMAPHIIRPLRFVLPHHKGLRPAWLLRLGLFLYDNLGGRKRLPATRTLDLRTDPAGAPLKDDLVRGFEYSDCAVDDARLVVLNARDAADRGAEIFPRTKVVKVEQAGAAWTVTLATGDGARRTVSARMVVNAAGPWVDDVLKRDFGRPDAHHVRLVQGSHIVVRKLFDHDRAYIFQNADQRIIFAIPYEEEFTLIGTTDRDYEGDPHAAAITPEETAYLLRSASEYFKRPVRHEDIVWSFAGVRPLFDDGASKAQEATRDYVLRTEGGHGEAALLNVFGGKLTTYRKLAEAAAAKVGELIGPRGKAWTAGAPLPGGHMPLEAAANYGAALRETYQFLPERLARRLARLYGLRAQAILEGATRMADLGRHFGADLYEREVRYLIAFEWATKAEDVLWRRTKLGLRFSADEVKALENYMAEAAPAVSLAAE